MKVIPLSNGLVAQVSDEDFARLNKWKWSAHQSKKGRVWYAIRCESLGKVDGKPKTRWVYMHRDLLNLSQRSEQADHIDGDGLNNQRSNLRRCSNAQNQMARCKHAQNATSKYKGVSRDGQNPKKWRAILGKNNKYYQIGRFDCEEDAAIAYNVAAQLFFGEFAYLNPV